MLAVWTLRNDNSFSRMFAHEMSKQLGKNRLTNTWELVPQAKTKRKKSKGAKQGGGYQLIIKVGEVVGFTEETWREAPASDMSPILLPWETAKAEVWEFRDDEVAGGKQ